jgi:hypothetical protein
MNSYPRLSEMGVIHPEQISRYSLSSLDYTDFLRIVYDRPKNSALPLSRTYRFPRVQQEGNGDSKEVALMRTNPALKEALEELRDLVDSKVGQRDVAEDMRHELRRLEEDIALQAERLRALIDKIEG